jgi:predicted MPP superfamily phosphohydrolase
MIPNKNMQKTFGLLFGIKIYYFLINIILMIIPLSSTNNLEILKLLFTVLITIIGIINVYRIKITKYNITVNKNINNLDIVMFADLHLGKLINHVELAKIVNEINNIKPDLLLIPGDFFNGSMKDSKELYRISDELKRINTTYGIYLSPGNHDLFIQTEELRNFLNNCNILLLDDKVINLDKITIIGRKDKSPIDTFRTGYKRKSIKELLINGNMENLLILLDHQPGNLNESADNNIDITLSGHTHRGQIFPFGLITKLININHYGYKRIRNTHTIVTSGIGYWQIPLRIYSNSELVHIKIKKKV